MSESQYAASRKRASTNVQFGVPVPDWKWNSFTGSSFWDAGNGRKCRPARHRGSEVTLSGVLWPPRRRRAIGSASGEPSPAAERLQAAVVGAPELRLPPPAAPDGPPTESEHAACSKSCPSIHSDALSYFYHSLMDASITFCCRMFQTSTRHCFSSSTLSIRHSYALCCTTPQTL